MAENILQTRDLVRDYDEIRALDHVNLEIPRGCIYGLIGPNGAGKTTLLRLLATTLEPTLGEVRYEGRNIWADPVAVRMEIGFMPDFFEVYRGITVREMLRYFGLAHNIRGRTLDERVDEVIGVIGLADKRDTHCQGLSRGMVQRLGLGRVLLHRPKLLLLDEPASGMDPRGREDLFRALRKAQADGTTVVISSHILGELSELCTHVGMMDRGTFPVSGPTREVIRNLLPHRKLRLTVLEASFESAMGVLKDCEAVREPAKGPEGDIRFDFEGEDEQLADLHGRLVGAGVRVVLLAESSTTLHEAYFAVSKADKEATDAAG